MSDQRYPITIRTIGVMHKNKSKMYMTSVLWSDDSDIIVYRSFQDFKQFHKQLKKRFPAEGSFGKSKRLIPKFKDGTAQTTKKGPNKSLIRLKFLEKYFDELLKCDPQITRGTELTQFFLPKAEDLQPDFAKNSIVVIPSEELHDGRDQMDGGRGYVSQPFGTEVYRCVAPYETKDTKNRPFKVAVDETVDVLIKDRAGWWLVENHNKCMAWFPAPYLENCDGEEYSEDEDIETPEEGVLYCALKNITSTKADEVSVSIGAVVEVLQKSDNGWWLIRYKGKVGYVPSMYLQPYTNPKVRFVNMQKEMRSSTLNLAQLSDSMPESTWRGQRALTPLLIVSHDDGLAPCKSESDLSLSPDDRLALSKSESDLFKGPVLPKVPPRPHAQEILTRCTTITRKAAQSSNKTQLAPDSGLMQSR